MSIARDGILGRIRSALHDIPADECPEDVSIVRNYWRAEADTRAGLVKRFIDRLVDYKATVQRVNAAELQDAIAAACAARGVRRLVVPTDLLQGWEPSGVTLLRDEELTNRQLDESDGVLTGCALAIAQTGTIVLDSGTAQGRRAITLLPDYHLCIVRAEQIVGLVPEAIARLHRGACRPITFISGPSATSDIELSRVEGVHGPRTLEVLIVES